MEIPGGDLALVICEQCGFIFNHAFDPQKIMYGADYEQTQASLPSFNEYMDERIRHMILECNVRACQVAEVG